MLTIVNYNTDARGQPQDKQLDVNSIRTSINPQSVADQRSRRDGRFIERIGTYDPGCDPVSLTVDRRRLEYWQGQGARPSHTLARLLKKHPAAAPEAGAS